MSLFFRSDHFSTRSGLISKIQRPGFGGGPLENERTPSSLILANSIAIELRTRLPRSRSHPPSLMPPISSIPMALWFQIFKLKCMAIACYPHRYRRVDSAVGGEQMVLAGQPPRRSPDDLCGESGRNGLMARRRVTSSIRRTYLSLPPEVVTHSTLARGTPCCWPGRLHSRLRLSRDSRR